MWCVEWIISLDDSLMYSVVTPPPMGGERDKLTGPRREREDDVFICTSLRKSARSVIRAKSTRCVHSCPPSRGERERERALLGLVLSGASFIG